MRMERTRWIPKESEAREHPEGLGVVYISRNGKLSAIAYHGKATRADWHYLFRSEESLERKIGEYFASLSGRQQQMAEWRAQRNKPHSLKVGEIVYNSWGYEQTNIDFYEVVKVSEHFVWLRQLCQETTEEGFMQGRTIPLLGQYREVEEGKPAVTKHKASAGEYGVSVNFEFGSGNKWNGKPQWCSWYA